MRKNSPDTGSPECHILVVDDDAGFQETIRIALEIGKFRVTSAFSGEEAFELAGSVRPDVILLDLMLPGIDGMALCKLLRSNPGTSQIPIIMLTAKGEEADVVAGLNIGADDYISKPFNVGVLQARINAIVRRMTRTPDLKGDEIRINELIIHPGKRKVFVHGEPADLTFTEFELLMLLVSRPGWVITRSRIVENVHDSHYPVTERSVDFHIVGLRRKLGKAQKYIETVRGVGYRFREL